MRDLKSIRDHLCSVSTAKTLHQAQNGSWSSVVPVVKCLEHPQRVNMSNYCKLLLHCRTSMAHTTSSVRLCLHIKQQPGVSALLVYHWTCSSRCTQNLRISVVVCLLLPYLAMMRGNSRALVFQLYQRPRLAASLYQFPPFPHRFCSPYFQTVFHVLNYPLLPTRDLQMLVGSPLLWDKCTKRASTYD